MSEQAVNVAAVAAYLGLHAKTVYAKAVDTSERPAEKGEIPGFRPGGRPWRFFISEIDKHMREGDVFSQSAQSRGRKRVA